MTPAGAWPPMLANCAFAKAEARSRMPALVGAMPVSQRCQELAMTLSSFGYASLRSDRIDDWAEYGAKFLGLQLVERTRSTLKFRMDDRKQRIVVSSEEGGET